MCCFGKKKILYVLENKFMLLIERLKFHRITFCIFISLLGAGDQIQAFQILLSMTQTLKAPKIPYEFEGYIKHNYLLF